MKRNVLFVDDELNMLEGLKLRLHRQRTAWNMAFVSSGEEALALMEAQPVDVVVTDMRMPGMDGATLLREVQKRFPRAVRIVLSGHAEVEAALRAIPVAHQFLSKPCEAGQLESIVERACKLQGLISGEAVRRIVGRIERLPTVPRVFAQLTAAIADEKTNVDRVAQIMKQDVAMCARALQIVNSAFFRLSRKISRVEEAISYLGFNTVKQLVLAVEVFQASDARQCAALELLQRHSLAVAGLARLLPEDKACREDAFIAGLLHDIGKLVLMLEVPEHLERAEAESKRSKVPVFEAETAAWGVTHSEVGGYLLGLWGLPYPIVEAVANHHTPRRVESTGFGVLEATWVANALVAELEAPNEPAMLDVEHLTARGYAGKIEEWRKLAASEREHQ